MHQAAKIGGSPLSQVSDWGSDSELRTPQGQPKISNEYPCETGNTCTKLEYGYETAMDCRLSHISQKYVC